METAPPALREPDTDYLEFWRKTLKKQICSGVETQKQRDQIYNRCCGLQMDAREIPIAKKIILGQVPSNTSQ